MSCKSAQSPISFPVQPNEINREMLAPFDAGATDDRDTDPAANEKYKEKPTHLSVTTKKKIDQQHQEEESKDSEESPHLKVKRAGQAVTRPGNHMPVGGAAQE